MARRTPSRHRSRRAASASLDWGKLVAIDDFLAVLDAKLCAAGWQRAKAVRARRTATGSVTIYFVWHRNKGGWTEKHAVTYRGLRLDEGAAP